MLCVCDVVGFGEELHSSVEKGSVGVFWLWYIKESFVGLVSCMGVY